MIEAGDFKRAFERFQKDEMTQRAAALTYYSLLSLFPALLFGVAVLGFFGQEGLVRDAADYLKTAGAPRATVDAVASALESAQSERGTALGALILGLATALYGASGAFGAAGSALNQVWRVQEGRGFVKHKLQNLAWTLVLMVLVLITCVLVFLGGGLAADVLGLIGLGDTAVGVWRIARWPAALLSAMLIYAIVYYAAPNVEIRNWQYITPGAVSGVALWIARVGGVLRLRVELLVLLGHIRRVRRCRNPAHLAVAHELGAAVRRRAECGRRAAPSAESAARIRRSAASAEGAAGRLRAPDLLGGCVEDPCYLRVPSGRNPASVREPKASRIFGGPKAASDRSTRGE